VSSDHTISGDNIEALRYELVGFSSNSGAVERIRSVGDGK
jgi:hypothetical protein